MFFVKRLMLFIVVVAVIVFAIAISGLNTEKVLLNMYFFKFELSLGFLLILSLFTGLLIGLLMALFNFYMPLKSQIRNFNRQKRQVTQQERADKRLKDTDD